MNQEINRAYNDLFDKVQKLEMALCHANSKLLMDKRDKEFIELVYELAFGDDAINKGYSHEEVLERITEFSDLSLRSTTKSERSR